MKIKITTDIPMHWRGGAKPLITDYVICEANDGEEYHGLTTTIVTALSQMEYGDVKKIVIENLD